MKAIVTRILTKWLCALYMRACGKDFDFPVRVLQIQVSLPLGGGNFGDVLEPALREYLAHSSRDSQDEIFICSNGAYIKVSHFYRFHI